MEHILDACPAIPQAKQHFLKNRPPPDYLKKKTSEIIIAIINFLKKNHLYNKILNLN